MDIVWIFKYLYKIDLNVWRSGNREISRAVNSQGNILLRVQWMITHLFDELKFLRTEQVSCSTNIVKFQTSLGQMSKKIGQVIDTTNAHIELSRAFAYNSAR